MSKLLKHEQKCDWDIFTNQELVKELVNEIEMKLHKQKLQ